MNYKERTKRFAEWMESEGIQMVVFSDFERARNPSVRYFSGHPSDALLCICSDGRTMLVAWDVLLGRKLSNVDILAAYTDFARNEFNAVQAAATEFGLQPGSRIEIPDTVPYPEFLHYIEILDSYDVICRNSGASVVAAQMRAVKDSDEIAMIRIGSEITNSIIDAIESYLKNGGIKTEYEVASFIERQALIAGCDGLGFTTLAAGPDRSFGIHAFPPYTAGTFGTTGLSILDFGVVYGGYTSDVTLTVATGRLQASRKQQLDLVTASYETALALYMPGNQVSLPAKKVTAVFSRQHRNMPHALGHGIGLEAHEQPVIKDSAGNNSCFVPGMVCTLEPGLYDQKIGGCRLENDILITANGYEVLTKSRIIHL